MKRRALLILFILVSFAFLIEACSCGCGNNKDDNVVRGYIVVVENEPFTKLAILGDDNKTYLLKCSKELQDELWQKQGHRYYIKFSSSHKEGDLTVLDIEKVIPIITENKTN